MQEEQLLELIRKNERKIRQRNMLVILLILIVGVLFTVMATMSVKANKEKAAELIVVNDSLEHVTLVYKETLNKEDTIRKKIDLYYKRRNSHDSQNMSYLFEDTLQRYYLLLNYPVEKMLIDDKKFWKRFPEDSFEVNQSEIAINSIDSTTTRAMIKARYCIMPDSCKEVVEELRFNDNLKIYWVRAYNVAK